ncbi:hydroxyisourate hydrolase [Paenibacillus sp. 2TAF8]|jgi:5-hydroxyisourate hydrolase|uniref:hydroxyisourate hydrolase n=1 Tax=Paenibacillus sp. 2TAF8 TaxID=3233020 RepID=UPI003F9B76D4
MQLNAGRITTHVLDTSIGVPAAGVRIELYTVKRLGNDEERISKVKESLTNPDGRLDAPLLPEGELEEGEYELRFHVDQYFAQAQAETTHVLWTVVPIRFAVKDTGSHYHIPLLIAPGGYSTYRGS